MTIEEENNSEDLKKTEEIGTDKKQELTIKLALRISLAILISTCIFSIPFYIYIYEYKVPKQELNILYPFYGAFLTIIYLLILFVSIKKYSSFHAIGLTGINIKRAIKVAVITGAIFLFLRLFITKFDIFRISINLKSYFSHWNLIIHVIANISIRPFVEEIFFRGIWYGVLIKKIRFLYASVIVSLAFSIIHHHQSISQYVWTFFFGIILALIYEKTKNLYTSIITHVLYNLLFFFFVAPNYLFN